MKFALPNDLWIGRVPRVFRPGQKRLSAMTFLFLSLGRAVVQKVIAEHLELQMRSSVACGPTCTAAFPQAQRNWSRPICLPRRAKRPIVYLADCLSIALVGAHHEAAWLLGQKIHFVLLLLIERASGEC